MTNTAVNRRKKLAVTMMEICIVGILASIILGVGMAMMTRSNRQFKKGNDLINIQRLMDNIVERMRSDIRSLKKVEFEECTDNKFVFVISKDGIDVTITYTFEPETKTFFRAVSDENPDYGNTQSDFHGANQVLLLTFKPEFDDENNTKFNHLKVIMQIASNEFGGNQKDISTLSIACQFYSTCVESKLRIKDVQTTN